MTLEELDQKYPNGLDDAEITGLAIDYKKRSATFQLNLRGNLPDSPERDLYSEAVLQTSGLYYLSIEPPDVDHLRGPDVSKITVDGLPEDPDKFPAFGRLKPDLPAGAFCCRFYVHDWNSFIHIAAKHGELRWTEAAEKV